MCLIEALFGRDIETHKWCFLLGHTFGVSCWSTQLMYLIKGHIRSIIEANRWCVLLSHTSGVPYWSKHSACYWSTQMVCLLKHTNRCQVFIADTPIQHFIEKSLVLLRGLYTEGQIHRYNFQLMYLVQRTLITFSRVFSAWQIHCHRTSTEFRWLFRFKFVLKQINAERTAAFCSTERRHTDIVRTVQIPSPFVWKNLSSMSSRWKDCLFWFSSSTKPVNRTSPVASAPFPTVQSVSYPSKPHCFPPPSAAHTISLYQYPSVSGITTASNLSLSVSLLSSWKPLI